MKLEKQLAEKLMGILSGCGATVRNVQEFLQKREDPIVIVVAHDNTQQVNIGLPDYAITFSILLDAWIEDDRDGEKYEEVKDKMQDRLIAVAERGGDLHQWFGDLPVVGFFLQGFNYSLTSTSNRLTASVRIITSE